MEKNRDSKVIAIIALVIAVVGLSVGFAAFTQNLQITPTATVKADSSKFKVEFSNSTEVISGDSETVQGKFATGEEAGGNAGTATITATTMTNATATITKDDQEITYEWYVVNDGELDAYLTKVEFNPQSIACAATGESMAEANTDLINTACKTIKVTLTVDSDDYTTTDNSMTGKKITAGDNKKVKLSIKAGEGTTLTDSDYTVTVGTITLTYSSKDNAGA